jgi:hypothetical protein
VAWYGQAVGNFVMMEQNATGDIGNNNDGLGLVWYIPFDAVLDYAVTNITTRRDGETSKGIHGGSTSYSFPADFLLRYDFYKWNPITEQVSSNSLSGGDWELNALSGDQSLDSRVSYPFPCSGVSVSAGDYLLLLITNREANPSDNYPVMNNGGRVGPIAAGLSPPRRCNRFMGDYPIIVRKNGSTIDPYPRTFSNGQTILAAANGFVSCQTAVYGGGEFSNVQIGQLVRDGTGSRHKVTIGGSNRMRVEVVPEIDMTVDKIVLGVTRQVASPGAGLLVEITGTGVSYSNTFSSGSFVQAVVQQNSDTYDDVELSLGSSVNLQAGVSYTIELSSSGSSSTDYAMSGGRDGHADNKATSRHMDPVLVSPSNWTDVSQHRGTGNSEKSTNGGSTWTNITWSDDNTGQFPVALLKTGVTLGTHIGAEV